MSVHQRPLAVMFRDSAAGHRSPFTGEVVGDVSEWTEWDYALIYAVQTIEDFTDQYGLLAWEMDDEAIDIRLKEKIHPFKAEVDRATGAKNYKPAPGLYYVPEVRTIRSDGHIQTFTEWVNKTAED